MPLFELGRLGALQKLLQHWQGLLGVAVEQAIDRDQFQLLIACFLRTHALSAGLAYFNFQDRRIFQPTALWMSAAQGCQGCQRLRPLPLFVLGVGFPVQRAIGAASFQLDDIVKQLLCSIPAALVQGLIPRS